MKRVFIVTGAAGFLGNTVVKELLNRGEKVRALCVSGHEPKSLKDTKAKIYFGDITKKETLKDIFSKAEDEELVVIHCAAVVYIKNKKNPRVDQVNVNGTMNIVEKCLETSARMIYVNSVHSIPEPKDDRVIKEIDNFNPDDVVGIYAKSKALGAKLVREAIKDKGLNCTIVQPSGIMGPGDYGMTHLSRMFLVIAQGKLPAIVKGGYDFVDVRDVANGIISAVDNGKVGESYLLSNRYISIRDIADSISKVSGSKRVKTVLPLFIAKIGAPFMEAYYGIRKQVPLFTSYSLHTLNSKCNFTHEKATKDLGYTTRSLDDTVKDTLEFFREIKQL